MISLAYRDTTIINNNHMNLLHIPGEWYEVPVKRGMLLIVLFAIFIITCTSTASADTISVPDNYTTIQLAVNNANVGDIIIVQDGIYNENVDVYKQLTIRSENGSTNCIVTAKDPVDHTFEITGNSVKINGFTVNNATGSQGMTGWKKAGIYVKSNFVNISDCIIKDNRFGIYTYFSNNIVLTRNIVRDNKHGVYFFSAISGTLTHNTLLNNTYGNLDVTGTSGEPRWFKQAIDTSNTVNGKPVYYYTDSTDLVLENLDAGHISLVNCTGATVRGCSVNDSDGIKLIFTNDSLIEENTACDNNGYAIRLLYSNRNIVKNNTANDNNNSGNGIRIQYGVDNRVEDNTLKRNQIGIYVSGGSFPVELCQNTTIINNLIENNWLWGCIIEVSSHNQVKDNTIQGSEYPGLYFSFQSRENLIIGNRIINNGQGIKFSGNSNISIVYNNYFNNSINAEEVDSTNIWNTTNITGPNIIGGPFIGGNYWSDYTGNDINGNGFGDEPYENISGSSNMDYLPLVHVQGICGDLDGNSIINIMDVRLLMNNVSGVGYPVDPWAGNVDGDDDIDGDDVWLLVRYVFDPDVNLLNCNID